MTQHYIPYCGVAPTPGSIKWNFDPVLLAILAAGACAYALAFWILKPSERAKLSLHPIAFAAGWIFLVAAFISPLCNLGVALFSARIGQHMVLALIAAPLLVIGGADILVARAFGRDGRQLTQSEIIAAPLLFALALWLWHTPAPYDAALHSHVVYWLMEISLLLTSALLWRCLLRDLSRNPGAALAASLFTALQMTGIGALLAFAPRALFTVHFTTTQAFGLSPLEDQQLGGLIMWLPFGLILTIHVIGAIAATMRNAEQRPADFYRSVSR